MFETSNMYDLRVRRITRRAFFSGVADNALVFVAPWRSGEARGLDLAKFIQLARN
nr:Hypothetical protein SC2p2_00890 [Methylocystis sp. SC2]